MGGRVRVPAARGIVLAGLIMPASLCPLRPAGAVGPFTFETGFQLEIYSESYGLGDLFSDIEETPSLEPAPADDTPLRFERDASLPGGYVDARWSPGGRLDREVSLGYAQDENNATGDLDGSYAFDLGRRWTTAIDERLRMQWGLEDGDRTRDLLHRVEVRFERAIGSGSRLEFSGIQELSRVSGDSLSRLYDYSRHGLEARLSHRLRSGTLRGELGWIYRDSPTSYSGDHHRFRAGIDYSNYGLESWSCDLSLVGTRRLYAADELVAPSDVEGELTTWVRRALTSGIDLLLDGDYLAVGFDDPDETYYSYLEGRLEVGAGWTSLAGPSVELRVGGKWLRPQTRSAGAHDQSRLALRVGYAGESELWGSVEAALGHRNYHGSEGTSGVLSDVGALDFDSSDFLYDELTALLGYAWQALVIDVYGQHTRERHENDADDVSFLLFNLRLGVRF